MMNSKRWAALIIAAGLFIVSIITQISTSATNEQYENLFGPDKLYSEKIIKEGNPLGSKIVVLNLDGVIEDVGEMPFMSPLTYNHKWFLQMIERAGEDPTVDGVILQVNTPGGGVVESAEINQKIKDVQEKYNKPVYVSMGSMAASGGYYISAPADKVVAHPATLTGSIGVIMQSINFAKLADDIGIDFNTITSGKYKDILSPAREMTKDEEDILQQMVDEMYDEFVNVIVEGRDMPEETVRKLADGRIYTGKQAKDLELVDELGTLEDTIAMMENDFDLENSQVVKYRASIGVGSIFGLTTQKVIGTDYELLGVVELLRQSGGPRAMYLYAE